MIYSVLNVIDNDSPLHARDVWCRWLDTAIRHYLPFGGEGVYVVAAKRP